MTRDRAACAALDDADPLAPVRDRFVIPEGLVYLDGNSLGALPRQTPDRVARVVEREWGEGLVAGWTESGWIDAPARIGDKIAQLIGAAAGEVLVAESTTVCLHKLVAAALQLRPGRRVVLTEQENFHTDLYVAAATAQQHGGTLRVVPRSQLRDAIDASVGVLMLTHVDFRTGEMHDMRALTAAAHDAGALALWDLCHSVGAVPLQIAADGVDMAVGCGYKYLNGGPGSAAFLHVDARHHEGLRNPIPGWLGHAEPFAFDAEFRPAPGLRSMISGSPHIVQLAALESGVDVWLDVDLDAAWRKSRVLTELFIELVDERCAGTGLEVASPREATRRGSQVALRHEHGYGVVRALIERGVVGDFRAPDICRFGFAPLYLRHVDVWDAVERLASVLRDGAHLDERHGVRAAVT